MHPAACNKPPLPRPYSGGSQPKCVLVKHSVRKGRNLQPGIPKIDQICRQSSWRDIPLFILLFPTEGVLAPCSLAPSLPVGGLVNERVCRHVCICWVERVRETKTPHAKAGRDWNYSRVVKLCRAQSGGGKTVFRLQGIWGLSGTRTSSLFWE